MTEICAFIYVVFLSLESSAMEVQTILKKVEEK